VVHRLEALLKWTSAEEAAAPEEFSCRLPAGDLLEEGLCGGGGGAGGLGLGLCGGQLLGRCGVQLQRQQWLHNITSAKEVVAAAAAVACSKMQSRERA
jgi:hypothetical protein